MLEKQKEINDYIIPGIWNYVPAERRNDLSKEYGLALMMECAEFIDQLSWKFWKKTKNKLDIEEIKFELIDIQHFLNCLYLIWGMGKEDIFAYYMAKANENIKRQKGNY